MNLRSRCRFQIVLAGVVVMTGAARSSPAVAAEPARAADEQAIRAAADGYQKAVAAGDAAAIAGFWLPDGDIVDAAGNRIAAPIAVPPAAEGGGVRRAGDPADEPAGEPECRLSQTTIRFAGPDTAIEDGMLEIASDRGGLLSGRFSAVWVRRDGRWKLAAVREAAAEPPAGSEALAALDWMVGDWVVVEDPDAAADAGRPTIEVAARWNERRTFLTRELTITHAADEPPVRITQRIGWDPLAKSIHSWKFGSDGTHGEAIWSRDGGSWIAQARTVGPDGSQGSSLNIYTYDGKDRCGWRSLSTDIGGRQLPPVDLVMVRKPPAGQKSGSQR
jgi:ketosteroid isomerase-like protein